MLILIRMDDRADNMVNIMRFFRFRYIQDQMFKADVAESNDLFVRLGQSSDFQSSGSMLVLRMNSRHVVSIAADADTISRLECLRKNKIQTVNKFFEKKFLRNLTALIIRNEKSQSVRDKNQMDRLGFACIDVYDMEPPIPKDYPLLHAKNTILTPHQAFISEESMIRRAKIVFDNVYAYLEGKPVNVCE